MTNLWLVNARRPLVSRVSSGIIAGALKGYQGCWKFACLISDGVASPRIASSCSSRYFGKKIFPLFSLRRNPRLMKYTGSASLCVPPGLVGKAIASSFYQVREEVLGWQVSGTGTGATVIKVSLFPPRCETK